MTVYYNENDPRAAAWLRELIHEGLIAKGDVDERSIEDVFPKDLDGYRQCHFFAGIGGWPYALRLAGWPDDRPVWTGSCPCQPFSAAGKGKGFADERHLWPAWFYLIEECGPPVIFGEQVSSKAGLSWWDVVSADLEASNYACGAVDTCAASVGLPHVRQRLFWVAEASDRGRFRRQGRWTPAARTLPEFTGLVRSALSGQKTTGKYSLRDDGVPGTVAILRGFGNAIVPQVAAEFINAYLQAPR